jgi:cytochrome oxidase Cu insertion factor (SCO1/SenC/PrrC family)
MSPRAKLVSLAALFALPIAASILAYRFLALEPTANYGELLLPPAAISAQPFETPGGPAFAFPKLAGSWILVASDTGDCPRACLEKLVTLRQVRLALGRNAARVARVFVVDDSKPLAPAAAAELDGTVVAVTPRGLAGPPGATNDRAHIYLVDPRGNVMLRWPAGADRKRMLGDLQRLLKASQIG